MKKLILIFVLIFSIHQAYSYTWESFGPEGIKANKICFFNSGPVYSVICVDTGMYISANSAYFEFYSYTNMAVVEAVSPGFNEDSLILVMSNGSWSDGIYSFNYESKQFSPLHFCWKPNFVLYDYYNEHFFVGYEYGLLYSEDAINWTDVPYFEFITCIDMEISVDYLVVATTEEYNNTFLSDDNGAFWTELEGENITELVSGHYGNNDIYGISKGESYNCGFFRFDFSWLEWDDIFYSSYLNALGTDNTGTPFLGWHSAIPPHEGIARYKFYNPNSGLMFINEGLPDLNIISIATPSGYYGGNIVYCCTESGIYTCNDFAVGSIEVAIEYEISINPNPVSSKANIRINLTEPIVEDILISILNNQGKRVDEKKINGDNSNEISFNWNKGDLPAGVYYLVIKTGKEQISEKFIIL